MPCYIQPAKPPTRSEFEAWKKLGYNKTWEHYCKAKELEIGGAMFVCGDLGDHCADCAAVGDFLCDYPVGEGKTCDRPICEAHSTEIGPDLHYCTTHYQMWQDFKSSGGVDEALRNVIAFKSEK